MKTHLTQVSQIDLEEQVTPGLVLLEVELNYVHD